MSKLQEALANLRAVEEINHAAIMAAYEALGEAAKDELELPEVDAEEMARLASLGRHAEGKE